MENSKIQWTHHTFNPWTGCAKVSPGCTNCYAEAQDKFYNAGKNWGAGAERQQRAEAYWNQAYRWNKLACAEKTRQRVFCASMADVFEDRPDLEASRERLFKVIATTPWLDWLLLTKRPENIRRLWPKSFEWGCELDEPAPNVWLGTTVEDPARAHTRVPELLACNAKVRFLSVEPMLGAIDLSPYLRTGCIDWVICGGESGHRARPFDLAWARDLQLQCAEHLVPFFMKQLGANARDGDREFRGPSGDVKLGNFASWPGEANTLHLREFPEVRR